jgi:uncharacterized protein YdhG (YjbR/CyaY superfamily)
MVMITVDDYISKFPKEVEVILREVRKIIKNTAPGAQEVISYGMPAYKYHGMLVYFAGYKNHIGFCATPNGHEKFKKELCAYNQGRGSVQFPLNEPLPYDLIVKIVNFRMVENLAKKSY